MSLLARLPGGRARRLLALALLVCAACGPTADPARAPTATPIRSAGTPATAVAAAASLTAPPSSPTPADATPTELLPTTTPALLPADFQGKQWELVGLPGQSLQVVGGTGQSDAAVYAGGDGLFRSTDRGATWAGLGLPPGSRVTDIQVSRANPLIIYAGTGATCDGSSAGGVFRSTDGGATWRALSQAPASVQVDAGDAQVLTAMDCTGMVRSTDGGQTWTARSDKAMIQAGGLHGARIRVPANPIGPLYATWLRADGSGRIRTSYDLGLNWGGEEHFFPKLADLLVDDKRPSYAWLLSQAGVVRTNDNGQTWRATTTGLDAAHPVHNGKVGPYQLSALAAQYTDAGDMDELYVGTYATSEIVAAGAFSSGDVGAVWGRFGGNLGGHDIRSIHVARQPRPGGGHAQVFLYAATDSGVFKIALGTSR